MERGRRGGTPFSLPGVRERLTPCSASCAWRSPGASRTGPSTRTWSGTAYRSSSGETQDRRGTGGAFLHSGGRIRLGSGRSPGTCRTSVPRSCGCAPAPPPAPPMQRCVCNTARRTPGWVSRCIPRLGISGGAPVGLRSGGPRTGAPAPRGRPPADRAGSGPLLEDQRLESGEHASSLAMAEGLSVFVGS